MAIYMKMPGVTGNVSSKQHQGWVEITSLYFDVQRSLSFMPNRQNNRTTGAAKFSSLELIKPRGASSNVIMESIVQAKNLPSLEIHCCSTGVMIEAYEKYVLSNVMFHHQANIDNESGRPSERVLLHYTQLTRTYIGWGVNNRPTSPHTTGFNLETLEVS
jgi:type VI secretion system secreted protein Hcp